MQFGSFGSEKGQFKYPKGIALDQNGNIYVADTENGRIQKFTNTGEFLFQIDSLVTDKNQPVLPEEIVVDKTGNIYVLADGIQKFSPSGQLLERFGSTERFENQYLAFQSIALDTTGNIYVSDGVNLCIHKYDAQGQHLLISSSGEYGHRFVGSKISIAIDAMGNLIAVDRRHQMNSSNLAENLVQMGNS